MTPAFKEWSLVCEGLGKGAYSLILRKGGIAEGRAGFEWKHRSFFLFPTHFHEQGTCLQGEHALPAVEEGQHRIQLYATLEQEATLTDWASVQRLAPFHPWKESVVQERYAYGTAGSLSVALIRVYQMAEPAFFPDAPRYGGCRSWVNVPIAPQPERYTPVLDEATHAARLRELEPLLGLANVHSH